MENLKKYYLYNEITGIFTRIESFRRRRTFDLQKPIGWLNNRGYLTMKVENKNYQAHRLAWFYVYGELPENVIDHIDGNRTNNAINNLRILTRRENTQNISKASKNNKIGVLGVSYNEKRKTNPFIARIGHMGNQIIIGYYPNQELAQKAYLEKKKELHPFLKFRL